MKSIKKILLSPYPSRTSIKETSSNILIVLAFILLMNLLFNTSSVSFLWGLLNFVILAISLPTLCIGIEIVSKKYIHPKGHLVIHQIFKSYIIILFILIINYGLNSLTLQASLSKYFLLPAVGISIISAILISFVDYYAQLRKNYYLTLELNKRLRKPKEALNNKTEYLIIKSKDSKKSLRLNAEEIQFVKAAGNYLEIYTIHSKILFRASLKEFSLLVSEVDYLIKTHRSYIVNIKKLKIAQGNSNGIRISLENCNEEIPVSRSKVKEIMKSPYFIRK